MPGHNTFYHLRDLECKAMMWGEKRHCPPPIAELVLLRKEEMLCCLHGTQSVGCRDQSDPG